MLIDGDAIYTITMKLSKQELDDLLTFTDHMLDSYSLGEASPSADIYIKWYNKMSEILGE